MRSYPHSTSPHSPPPPHAESRWKRTNLYATQISKGQKEEANGKDAADLDEDEEMDMLATNEKERQQIKKERQMSKQMEHQYWLEMCDSKHRYGTNLKVSLAVQGCDRRRPAPANATFPFRSGTTRRSAAPAI